MQPSQALINKTPWVAVYPAFFVNAINVYQTRAESQSSCPLWRSTTTAWECAAVTHYGISLGNIWPNAAQTFTVLCGPVGRITVIHSTEDAAIPGSIMVLTEHGDSHVEKHGPCDGPNNKPEAFLLAHMNACKHA